MHNMFTNGGAGSNNIIATPIYVGGTSPTNLAGWQLLSGSPGRRVALDGADMGALIGQTAPSVPPVAALAPPTGLKILQ